MFIASHVLFQASSDKGWCLTQVCKSLCATPKDARPNFPRRLARVKVVYSAPASIGQLSSSVVLFTWKFVFNCSFLCLSLFEVVRRASSEQSYSASLWRFQRGVPVSLKNSSYDSCGQQINLNFLVFPRIVRKPPGVRYFSPILRGQHLHKAVL